SSRRRHTSFSRDWSSDVCSSDVSERFEHGAPVRASGEPLTELGDRCCAASGAVGDDLVEDFGDTEQADDGGDEGNPVGQFYEAEGESEVAGDRVTADRTEEEPEGTGHEPFDDSAP